MARKMKIEEPTMQRYVPSDIILKILHRLPTNSLLRFTSVSKSWKACIKSPNFISAHHQINKNISCSHLLHMQVRGHKYCTLVPESSNRVKSETPFPPLTTRVEIVGSSEGLVCLIAHSEVYLWNPFIRSMKQINPVGQFQGLYDRLVFGFAPQSRDYKLVKLLVEGGYLTGAEIYSLSSDSWTKIKSPSSERLERSKIICLGHYVCFKGCIYWLVHLYNCESTMLRIDLDKQKIEEIEIDKSMINSLTAIKVVNGFLVLIQSYFETTYIYQESSSSWTAVRIVDLPIGKADVVAAATWSGHIIFEKSPGRLFACDGYYDGKDLSFRLRDLGIKVPITSRGLRFCNLVTSREFGLFTPIKETLHLLDEKQRYGRRRKGKAQKHIKDTLHLSI